MAAAPFAAAAFVLPIPLVAALPPPLAAACSTGLLSLTHNAILTTVTAAMVASNTACEACPGQVNALSGVVVQAEALGKMLGPAVFAPLFAVAVARRPLYDTPPPPPDIGRAPPAPPPKPMLPVGAAPLLPPARPPPEPFALRLASDGATLCFALVALLLVLLGLLMLCTSRESVEPAADKEACDEGAAGGAPKGEGRRGRQSGKATRASRLSLDAGSGWADGDELRSWAARRGPIPNGSRARPWWSFERGAGGARLLAGSLSSSAELGTAEIASRGLECGSRSLPLRAADPATDLQGIHLAVQ